MFDVERNLERSADITWFRADFGCKRQTGGMIGALSH